MINFNREETEKSAGRDMIHTKMKSLNLEGEDGEDYDQDEK